MNDWDGWRERESEKSVLAAEIDDDDDDDDFVYFALKTDN